MTRCPWCHGKVGTEPGCTFCNGYMGGEAVGRRQGHLEALRLVQEQLDRTPGTTWTEGLVDYCRRRLAQKRRSNG